MKNIEARFLEELRKELNIETHNVVVGNSLVYKGKYHLIISNKEIRYAYHGFEELNITIKTDESTIFSDSISYKKLDGLSLYYKDRKVGSYTIEVDGFFDKSLNYLGFNVADCIPNTLNLIKDIATMYEFK